MFIYNTFFCFTDKFQPIVIYSKIVVEKFEKKLVLIFYMQHDVILNMFNTKYSNE